MSEKEKTSGGIWVACENRKARHNYFIEEKYEAGMVLKGTEVKSLRAGKGNLQDSYAVFKGGELFLINAHINPYAMGNRENHEPERSRKLLMKASELDKLVGKIETKGYNLIPLKIYFKSGIAKVEVGLAKGKKQFDKRAATKERDMKREVAKYAKQKNR